MGTEGLQLLKPGRVVPNIYPVVTASLFIMQEILEEHPKALAFLYGLKAIFFKVLRVKSCILEVFDDRCSCFPKEVLLIFRNMSLPTRVQLFT